MSPEVAESAWSFSKDFGGMGSVRTVPALPVQF
jgi:hypothetical protein